MRRRAQASEEEEGEWVSAQVPAQMKRDLETAAKADGRTLSGALRAAIRLYLDGRARA